MKETRVNSSLVFFIQFYASLNGEQTQENFHLKLSFLLIYSCLPVSKIIVSVIVLGGLEKSQCVRPLFLCIL